MDVVRKVEIELDSDAPDEWGDYNTKKFSFTEKQWEQLVNHFTKELTPKIEEEVRNRRENNGLAAIAIAQDLLKKSLKKEGGNDEA